MSPNNSSGGHGGGCSNGGCGKQARCGGNYDCSSSNCSRLQSGQAKFQGTCEALKGDIFDCSDHCQADHYATILKKLSEHIGTMFKNGGNVHASIVTKAKYTMPCPTPLTAPIDPNNSTEQEKIEQWLFEKRLDTLIKCKSMLNANIQCLYSLMLGQCMDLIQTKLKQQATWANVYNDQDGITLLVLIKTVVHQFEEQ